jgi:hypothetical protein
MKEPLAKPTLPRPAPVPNPLPKPREPSIPKEPRTRTLSRRDAPRSFDDILAFYDFDPPALDSFRVGEFKPPTPISLPNPESSSSSQPSCGEDSICSTDLPPGLPPIKLLWSRKTFNDPPAIPLTFQSLQEYQSAFIEGITYELNARVQETFRIYQAALFAATAVPPKCPQHGPSQFHIDRRGNFFYSCRSCRFYQAVPPDAPFPERKNVRSIVEIARFMHARHFGYHEAMFLRKGADCTLRFSNDKVENVEYSKDDIWVLFHDRLDPVFAVSESYGVVQKVKVEIGTFFDSRLLELPMQLKVTAIRLFNAQSERAAILKLIELDIEKTPILPALLSAAPVETAVADMDRVRAIADDICGQVSLNEDQRAALFRVADFFGGNPAPVLLVHGIFGAGKSKLLSVIAIFLDEVLTAFGRDDQVLVASWTNVAVDNVLSNLKDYEFLKFTRVGSVKKIRRSLLPFVSGHGNEESISELSSIISEADSAERSVLQEALHNAQVEMSSKRTKMEQARVVGVTCAATSFNVMSGRVFPFVLLDECSQQTEPISMLPVTFGCAHLVCCGDPLQLPPTVTKAAPRGYGRPLFSRLIGAFPPVMLSIQYRCHPAIAGICSRLFYKGRVQNGVSDEDRAPLFRLPTLCVFDLPSGQERAERGSVANDVEAIAVVRLVRYLLEIGVRQDEIGVIAFYKPQVEAIANPLREGHRHPIVDVSTVDAFQGDEREVIIITTTKTTKTSFIESPERINVAISRAKRHLFIVANVRPLIDSELWNVVFSIAGNRPNRTIRLDHAPNPDWVPF